MYRGRIKNIHFVGVGGAGMSGIAEVLLNLGYRVSGSDLKATNVTDRLGVLGIEIVTGHRKEHVSGADVVVYSSAVSQDNPEIVESREQQIPVIPRAEMLAELMRVKHGIAVAGTHGKTTTTSMIAAMLGHAGIDPTVVIGGKLNSMGSNAKLGKGEYLVAEADESDGSFVKLSPTIAVVTNIDREHMDYYHDMDDVLSNYLSFINKVPFYGCAVLCLDHPNIQSLMPQVTRRHVTYGMTVQSDVSARDIEQKEMRTSFTLWYRGEQLGRVSLGMPGEHSVYNALAAIAVGLELGVKFQQIAEGLEGFDGVQRRFQLKGEARDIIVVDDYGHHPEEIKVTLKAAKEGWGRRVVAVFQPHRYTRTRDLLADFFSAFNDADSLVITDIYPAGEEPIEGISSSALFEGIKAHSHKDVVYIPDRGGVVEYLMKHLSPGDLVVTLGAGDIWEVGEGLLEELNGGGEVREA
ncbi:MAG: UDP-N-acetylmuramate--L-alanine ligase [Deltaproteobacteria bacterium]|nr:UDP-N-acetylmuramate--L-alanine ligase [Deltaproteobacteria bacterium]